MLFAEAFVMFEDSLCGKCSQSGFYATDPHNDGQYDVDDDTVCLGCEALEQYKDPDPWPGQKLRVVRDMDFRR